MGLPPRSCATDAYHCIMVEVRAGPAEYKCVARSRAPWRAPLGSTTRIPEADQIRLDIKDPIQVPGSITITSADVPPVRMEGARVRVRTVLRHPHSPVECFCCRVWL